MKAINVLSKKRISLCLFLITGVVIFGQTDYTYLKNMASKSYEFNALISPNNQMWAIRKTYENNNDSVFLYNKENKNCPIAYFLKPSEILFPNDKYFIVKKENQVKILNANGVISKTYNGIKKIHFSKREKNFILLYENSKENKLEVRSLEGNLIFYEYNILDFFISENEDFFYIKSLGKGYTLKTIKNKLGNPFFSSPNDFQYLEFLKDNGSIIIHENDSETINENMIYLNFHSNTIYPLNKLFKNKIDRLSIEPLERNVFLIKADNFKKSLTKDNVEIWYGNDNYLENKFQSDVQSSYYLWRLTTAELFPLPNKNGFNYVNIKNPNFLLYLNPKELDDYTDFYPKYKLSIYDIKNQKMSPLNILSRNLYVSFSGDMMIFNQSDSWILYLLDKDSKYTITNKGFTSAMFSEDNNFIFFDSKDGIWKYNIQSKLLSKIKATNGFESKILNYDSETIVPYMFYIQSLNTKKPLLIQLKNKINGNISIVSLERNLQTVILPPTSSLIEDFQFNTSLTKFHYIEQNFNLPYRFVSNVLGKTQILFQSNKHDKSISKIRQEIIEYKNSHGQSLKGVLYYPIDFNPDNVYPLIVHIYQIQSDKKNKYLIPAFSKPNTDGFQLRNYVESGYFVFLPDIIYNNEGTGISALDCVNNALNSILSKQFINFKKVGLIGHSHGAYQVNFIATHSNRFATYVSGAGNSDIVRSYFSFNYNFQSPFYWQYETGQYEMNKSFKKDKEIYFKNNPIHFVDQVNSPVLLWAGKQDQNIDWNQTMEFYIGLKRNSKNVIALFYPNEGHAIFEKDNCVDLNTRILDWFNYFLKDINRINWIEMELKKDVE